MLGPFSKGLPLRRWVGCSDFRWPRPKAHTDRCLVAGALGCRCFFLFVMFWCQCGGWLEAIVRLEAIASRLEAIALRLGVWGVQTNVEDVQDTWKGGT